MTKFSHTLQKLLSGKQPITVQTMINNFAEKSFAILLLLLLAIPALPLPTGGVSHIFELIAILIALELIVGRKSVWLPKRWLQTTLPLGLQTSVLPKLIKFLSWTENLSRPRLSRLLKNNYFVRIIGVFILVFTIFALLAPPFTALDTLPSLGVVFLSLALILEDIFLTIIGIIIGSTGISLIIILGRLTLQLF
jgi:hypothetical protein